MSVANDCTGSIVVRSGALGAYVASRRHTGRWIDAYWEDHSKVVDVTGAGNTFLGGLAAGLVLCANDLEEGLSSKDTLTWVLDLKPGQQRYMLQCQHRSR